MTMFTLKQNDTRPALLATLMTAEGTAVNLTGASLRFLMKSDSLKVDAPATVLDAEAGTIQYVWVAADTDTAGTFRAEVEVTYADLSIETFPNDSYWTINITPDLG